VKRTTENAYLVMMDAVAKGRVPAVIAAKDEDGAPMAFFISVDFHGNPHIPEVGIMWAAAAMKRAYREAHAAGVEVLL
jgi:hypothetical protein